MNIVILGLSITSSWGNGHATTYRSLIKGLKKNGHSILFLERDVPWYADNRDLSNPDFCSVGLYNSIADLKKYEKEITLADFVIVGSYVPQGVEVIKYIIEKSRGIKAFYDIDTPVTFNKLENGDYEYLTPRFIPAFDIYLSFAGGKMLDIIQDKWGSPCAKPLYCSVDPDLYYPAGYRKIWDLGYLGTYSPDRQPVLNELLIKAAEEWSDGKFVIAGPQYPASIMPGNIRHLRHVEPKLHVKFYNKQKFTLNITRRDMVKMGFSPSVRLFEAAACGVPVISDYWEGLDSFFVPGQEIFISESYRQTLDIIFNTSEKEIKKVAENAFNKVLLKHTGEYRAKELEQYFYELKGVVV